MVPAVGLLAVLSVAAGLAQAQSYGPDVTSTGQAYSCGDLAGSPASNAFDDNINTFWKSEQIGAAAVNVACLGQQFSGTYDIRQITVRQMADSTLQIGLAYWQYSDDGVIWHTISALTLVKDDSLQTFSSLPASGLHSWWRIVAGDAPVNRLGNVELQMMEAIGNPTATPVFTATAPSATPTITLTPSTTPSPTPQYFIESTLSTLGAPVRIERTANFGQVGIAVFLMFILIVLVLILAVLVFKRGG